MSEQFLSEARDCQLVAECARIVKRAKASWHAGILAQRIRWQEISPAEPHQRDQRAAWVADPWVSPLSRGSAQGFFLDELTGRTCNHVSVSTRKEMVMYRSQRDFSMGPL
ncbi:hypothetical protein AALO_G00187150 [Alosa alosa]|uniref:Uncharacterized protein n=1 Tax=Alosa alosa TaxID=278164 RepID=A0AAV6G4J4_9TELE|nr:hypothetical protein AALO_G00187150 [Alosa alosa]